MNKTKKIAIYFLLGIILTFTALYAKKKRSETSTISKPMVFDSTECKLWVKNCIKQHPEILWLADKDVCKTEEGHATLEGSYSEQLFGQKYIEFDRTIMTIYCLKLILDGSDRAYEIFTADQNVNVKLSRKSFAALHLQAKHILESGFKGLSKLEIAQAIETALVLGDIGKSEKAREQFKPYGIGAFDHDDFHGEAMQVLQKHPQICPSFVKLPTAAKKLLIDTANLAHYGHITHLEGGREMFARLKKNSQILRNPIMLSFDLFVHTCDVTGALGHVNNKSSLVYTEHSHLAIQAMGSAVKVLLKPRSSEIDAYNAYLKIRASWLGLNFKDQSERILAKIGAMLRLFTVEEGTILKKAMLSLNYDISSKIFLALDIQEDLLNLRTPTYMPAVLVNLLNNHELGVSRKERLFQAIKIGLPFIAKVLEHHKNLALSGKINPKIPLCFNKAARVAKLSPSLLNGKFYIDQKGNVCIE